MTLPERRCVLFFVTDDTKKQATQGGQQRVCTMEKRDKTELFKGLQARKDQADKEKAEQKALSLRIADQAKAEKLQAMYDRIDNSIEQRLNESESGYGPADFHLHELISAGLGREVKSTDDDYRLTLDYAHNPNPRGPQSQRHLYGSEWFIDDLGFMGTNPYEGVAIPLAAVLESYGWGTLDAPGYVSVVRGYDDDGLFSLSRKRVIKVTVGLNPLAQKK